MNVTSICSNASNIVDSLPSKLSAVRSLKEEAIEGLRVLRYILWFGLHCDLLHAGGAEKVHGTCAAYLTIPFNSEYLTFHCDSTFLKLKNVFLHVSDTDTEEASDMENHGTENETCLLDKTKEWWEVPESNIVYDCGPDKTTCMMLLPNLQYLESRGKGSHSGRDTPVDWDECSTTESLDNVTPSGVCSLVVLFYFSARVNWGPEGLYLAQDAGAEESEDRTSPVLATALEQLFARRMFPCVDIAQHKAPFRLRMVIAPPCSEHSGAEVLSTTRVAERRQATEEEQAALGHCLLPSIELEAPCQLVFFEESVSLPPYSASMFYGVFEHSKSVLIDVPNNQRGVFLQCSLPTMLQGPTRLAQCDLALRWAEKVFVFLTRRVFHGLECKMNKLSFIPLRCQRGLGLENHGCITFKEDFFLIPDPTTVPILRVIRIYRLICHEICHQWIGNLFTPYEITDIWLKEGFVRFVEFLIVDALLECPEARDLLWASFLFEVKCEALIVDGYSFVHNESLPATAQSHPVQTAEPCVTLASLTKLFDSITYDKTASVLMMWDVVFSLAALINSQDPDPDDIQPQQQGVELNSNFYPRLKCSTFIPALAETFRLSEQEGSYLFNSDTIWQCCDIERNNRSRSQGSASDDTFVRAGIASPTPMINSEGIPVADLLQPWLSQVGFPCVCWNSSYSSLSADQAYQWKVEVWQFSKTRDSGSLWTVPLAFVLEYKGESRQRVVPFLLTCQSQSFYVTGERLASVSIVDGARGFGFFLLMKKEFPMVSTPLGWQSPWWQLSEICSAGMILNAFGVGGASEMSKELQMVLWSSWKSLEEVTCQRMRQTSAVLYLILSRIQQCQKRGPGPEEALLEVTIRKLRNECCCLIDSYGCTEIIHRSWTWLILGGLSWC
eukprot:Gregarina_sp_Pseudo_9__4108@NODE_424_length_2864_cov_8_975929_g401_i0_p1_GENE_NODE_424_length_2864_cov_8_975929_g401_i0NODE_424_length_2864_cov_8_975929_g401_i0_p1_ORF_typecomplete_len897_score35_67Peptidase_M1/PF01433_20/2e25Peptidase_M1_N/PF17900_1/4e02Peptidase_M1_N/PF17900_1/5_9e07DUF1570/PF07607_11/0_27_NODE_424_length_2864_cov_8_975929_g401_i01152805